MSMPERAFFPITTPPKSNTPYGKRGTSSLAGQLASAIPDNEFTADPNSRYGEIWMGDHPSNPSSLILDDGSKIPLWKVISKDPEQYIGATVCQKFEGTPSLVEMNDNGGEPLKHLPFLLKVLSFDKALPLQTHPDRVLTAELLRRGEEVEALKGAGGSLEDHNYKPEVAVCISEKFDGFIGFRPLLEIQEFLRQVPELIHVIGDENVVEEVLGLQLDDPSLLDFEDEKKLLKRLLSGIIRTKDEEIAEQCQKLATRLDEHGDGVVLGDKYSALGRVIRKCLKDYPNDKGVFVGGFLMNLVSLKYGEGVVVGVGEIHAYVEGDIIECMAWGDNVGDFMPQPWPCLECCPGFSMYADNNRCSPTASSPLRNAPRRKPSSPPSLSAPTRTPNSYPHPGRSCSPPPHLGGGQKRGKQPTILCRWRSST
ncbi:RmlC-like cupin domain-containing protein [Tirmania nivea]|nr:RmlC-like cupin domain-containing protein [Tirmania nivea]